MSRHPDTTSILAALTAKAAAGEPIIAVAASVGLAAKIADLAGADLIFALANGPSRHLGVRTTDSIGNATEMTLGMFAELDNVVDNTPIVGGVEGSDLSRRRLDKTVEEYARLGFRGIANFPTLSVALTLGQARDGVGAGLSREVDLMRIVREQGLLAVGFSYTPEHAAQLAAAGADLIIVRVGPTDLGPNDPKRADDALANACEHVSRFVAAVRDVAPGVLCLAQGGPFVDVADLEVLFGSVDVQGFLAESAYERNTITESVRAQVEGFTRPTLGRSSSRSNETE